MTANFTETKFVLVSIDWGLYGEEYYSWHAFLWISMKSANVYLYRRRTYETLNRARTLKPCNKNKIVTDYNNDVI